MISTPTCEISPPSGPMQKGTTYIVRPRMLPSNRPPKMARISSGGIQLLVGPASGSRAEQMNVRSSTRATSSGSEHAAKLLGRLSGLMLAESAALDQQSGQALPLCLRSVAPLDPVRLRQRGHLVTHRTSSLFVVGACCRLVMSDSFLLTGDEPSPTP